VVDESHRLETVLGDEQLELAITLVIPQPLNDPFTLLENLQLKWRLFL
jgi:hypothetical protein